MNDMNVPTPETTPVPNAPFVPVPPAAPGSEAPGFPAQTPPGTAPSAESGAPVFPAQTPQTPPGAIPYYPPVPAYYVPAPVPPSPTTLAIREAATLKKSPWLLLFALVAGYLYAETMFQGGFSGLAVPLCSLVYFLIFLWYLSGKKDAFTPSGWLLLLPTALLTLSYAFIDGFMTNGITTLVLLVLVPIQLTVMAGGGKLSGPSVLSAAMKTTIGLPFINMGSTFRIFSGAKREKKRSTTFGYIAIGLLCSIPVILIFMALFSSGDYLFRRGLQKIASLIDFDFGRLILNLMIAAILSLFTVPLFLSLRAAKPSEAVEKPVGGSLPPALVLSFLAGILLIQALFVGLQFIYFLPGTVWALPENHTYASFVHEGFAQISVAALLTALIIALVWRLCRKNEKGGLSVAVRIFLTALGLLDLALCGSAYLRMYLYIQAYSLTVLRLATCWLMALVLLLILGILIKVWAPKLKLFTWAMTCVVLMTLVLNGMNMDRTVAKYNVDRYIHSGYTYKLDTDYFYSLSPAALPELQRLMADPGAKKALAENGNDYLSYLIEDMESTVSSRTWRNHRFYF